MIPLRLQLNNFMCYGDNVSALELEGVRLACLSGDNGHGKSALLESMTWALWGKSRAKSDDDLIHLGRSDMSVEFDFQLANERYRVIRKRSLKRTGKRTIGTPTLELQVLGDLGYVPLSGNSINETQRKINELLRMEYETFINSAFLLQNRADEFTTKPPADRKRVLADILGLGLYDQLEERAKEQAKVCENERRELAAASREIETELARKPEYEEQLSEAQRSVEEVEVLLQSADRELRLFRERKKELDLKVAQIDDFKRRAQDLDRDLAQTESDINAQKSQIATFRSLLERRSEIIEGCQKLEEARRKVEEHNTRLSQLLKLNEAKSRLEREIQLALTELLREREGLTSRLSELTKISQNAKRWREDLASLEDELRGLQDVELRRDETRTGLQTNESQIALLKQINDQLKRDMIDLRERITTLGKAGAVCPLCETEIGEDGRVSLIGKLKSEGKELARKYREHEAQIKERDQVVQLAQQTLRALDQSLRTKADLQRRLAVIEKSVTDCEAAEAKERELAGPLAAIEARLTKEEYAQTERQDLDRVVNSIHALSYDQAEHEKAKTEVAELVKYAELKEVLSNAEVTVQAGMDKMEVLSKTQRRLASMLQETNNLLETAICETATLPTTKDALLQAEATMEAVQCKGRDARERLGRVQQMLGHCQYLEKQRVEKGAAQTKATEQKAIYDELSAAFGKNGIQAMIIDGALPEIEKEANALLARMTENRMHVSFETQREGKTSGGVIETLDINISDEYGQRGYEMYSGGEAFRANFAIRIALSKLLAHRAGARLQTLIIDEGFGTQDSQGRERLVECINSISDDFEKILVITHIQELKDAFPTRIDVVKTAEGSQIMVN